MWLVTNRPDKYDWNELEKEGVFPGDFDEFIHWINKTTDFQLDTETTMTPSGPDAHQDRKLLVVQLADLEGLARWVIEFTELDSDTIEVLKQAFTSPNKTFYIHNAAFDYSVLKSNLRVKLKNLHCTFLMSKVLNTGLELHAGYHSLAGCLNRFFGIVIDKTEQTTFTSEPMTTSQVVYAGDDVLHIGKLFYKLKALLESWDLWYVYNEIEREVVKVFCEMEMNPMGFNSTYWQTLATEFIAERDAILKNLNKLLLTHDKKLLDKLEDPNNSIGQCLVQSKDEYLINWRSSSQKAQLLEHLLPKLPQGLKTKPELKKWFKTNEDELTDYEVEILNYYIERKYDALNLELVTNHHEWLKQEGLFIPEGTVLVNWNSNVHKLLIFQHFYPNLVDTNAKSLNRIRINPIINEFKKYTSAQKRVSSYGENFLTKYVRRDGMIAPFGFNQILTTGRISFGILLQIPGTAKFRNAFLPPHPDWVFVDSDYQSAEVAIMSYSAGETAFLDAIKEGRDLHCMSASLIFSDVWASSAEPGCQQLIDGSKCNCPEHEKLRKFSKAITFGLAYGLTYHGLAERLDISKGEAKELIEKFFNTFTKLRGFFDLNSHFALNNRYIRGLAPANRIRRFTYPENSSEEEAMGREAKNFPIQEANASILKLALIYLAQRIERENLDVILHLPIHDEILSSCHKDFAVTYKQIQNEEMIRAAEVFLEKGLLGVDTEILDIWTK